MMDNCVRCVLSSHLFLRVNISAPLRLWCAAPQLPLFAVSEKYIRWDIHNTACHLHKQQSSEKKREKVLKKDDEEEACLRYHHEMF